jgi:hypothetical protein
VSKLTEQDKREFINRCKVLAERIGTRVKYAPPIFQLELYREQLSVAWRPDALSLTVRVQLPGNETMTTIVNEFRGNPQWGFVANQWTEHYLDLLRKDMVLDDLADV